MPGGSPGPGPEPGPDGGPMSERLVAGSATGPDQAQPERAMWHFSLPHPVDPPSTGETAGVSSAVTWVAVVVTGLSNPDLDSRG